MLFNSFIFIFFFLPIALAVFFQIGGRGHHRVAIAWLVGASLFFYAWWNPAYLGLILASMLFNYALGISLGNHETAGHWSAKTVLTLGIVINLGLLGYYKYANFFVANLNLAVGTNFHIEHIILPLAISFFTFQQIAYLVDAFRGETREYNFLHYCLFVTFFPQLIAGPIVHHREMLPQFANPAIYRLNNKHLAIGITIFTIGLFKKVIVADNVAEFSTPVFDAAFRGQAIGFFEAWTGALAYTFQLYFDFSGYADMAIGIARMFGVLLPLNFDSPYKAVNIVEFWRRWHMTLSRFLRDYLYVPLGGSRKGNTRRYVNLMTTMLLGGLWHGAGWTFVVWGGLHGLYLVINHAWHALRRSLGFDPDHSTNWGRGIARATTFLAVLVSWVFFRAESFNAATAILKGMVGGNGLSTRLAHIGQTDLFAINWGLGLVPMQLPIQIVVLLVFSALLLTVWILPNTQQIMAHYRPAFEIHDTDAGVNIKFQWHYNQTWGLIISMMVLLSFLNMHRISEFLYFQF